MTAGSLSALPVRPVIVALDDWEGALATLADWSPVAARAELRIHAAPLQGEALVAALAPAHAVVLNRDRTPFDAALLARLPNLRYLVFTGPRNRRIAYTELRARGIPVSATAGGPAVELTCEHTWALILACVRDIPAQQALVRGGGWRAPTPSRLAPLLQGERLGLIGCGRVGARVAAVGAAFGMQVVTWSPHMTAARAAACGASAVTLDELLHSSRVVSLHLVPSPPTIGLIGRERLAQMRADAFLVNTARAELLDHVALADALRSGRLAGAGLDVLPDEPLLPEDALRGIDRLLITPHTAFGSEAVFRPFAQGAVASLLAWLSCQPLPGLVEDEGRPSHSLLSDPATQGLMPGGRTGEAPMESA